MRVKGIITALFMLASFVSAKKCEKAKRKGNWDGKEVVEINVTKENLCKTTGYELCKPLIVELLEIENAPKKNYEFNFGITGLESDGTLFREKVDSIVEGNTQFYRIDFQIVYKIKYLLFGFDERMCLNEKDSDLENIKIKLYGKLDSTDDPSTLFEPEEAISLEDPKIKMVQKDCFDNILAFPFLFSQDEDDRDFLYEDIVQLRNDDLVGTEIFKKINTLTDSFGKDVDTTCRNWLYILALSSCYESQQNLPDEFIFDEMPTAVINLFNSMKQDKLAKRLTMCLHDMKPRKLDIEKKIEEEYKKNERTEL